MVDRPDDMSDEPSRPRTDDDAPITRADVEDRMRTTWRTALYTAIALLVVAAGLALGSGDGAVGTGLLVVGGIALVVVALRRLSTGSSQRASATAPGPIAVTDEDVGTAAALSEQGLDLDQVCRLTKPGYSWWPPERKDAFRHELARRLGS